MNKFAYYKKTLYLRIIFSKNSNKMFQLVNTYWWWRLFFFKE